MEDTKFVGSETLEAVLKTDVNKALSWTAQFDVKYPNVWIYKIPV